MTRRNPEEVEKKRYFNGITIRKIYPWLAYHRRVKCGDEFCREYMYECSEPIIGFSMYNYYEGCTHCFNSKTEFRQYLEDHGKIYTKDNYGTSELNYSLRQELSKLKEESNEENL